MKKLIFFLGFAVAMVACSSKSDSNSNGDSGKVNFDRTAILTNWADNIIIPGYENYQLNVNLLQTATTAFTATPNAANLALERTAWFEAYKAYQKIAIFNIGKAKDIFLNDDSNIYPADAAGIEKDIASGTYNLSIGPFSKQGFPGLDYLLNGLGADDATIVTFYTTNGKAANYKKYLTDLVAKLKENIDAVVTDWNTGGYRDTYIKNNGSSVTSAVSVTTNRFIKNFENDIRTAKVAIPAGVMSNGVKYPESVEGFYKKDISKELLRVAVQASLDFFNGKYFNSDATGPSLKSALDYVKAVRDGKKLTEVMEAQYAAIFTANDALTNSFSDQINTDNAKMLILYKALQQNVIFTKIDMVQALNITIDYADRDGD